MLTDPNRVFLSSLFVRLEVLPNAVFHHRTSEIEFHMEFFDKAEIARSVLTIIEIAENEAMPSGLASMDALHVAAASLLRAAAFVTTEKPGCLIHRTTLVNVRSLYE